MFVPELELPELLECESLEEAAAAVSAVDSPSETTCSAPLLSSTTTLHQGHVSRTASASTMKSRWQPGQLQDLIDTGNTLRIRPADG